MEDNQKIREVFVEELPRKNGKANKIDWTKTVGKKVKGIYEDMKFEIEIINYKPKGQYLTIKYNDEEYNIKTTNFTKCKLGNIIGIKTSDFKIKIGTRYKDEKRDITITEQKKIKGKGKCYKYHCNKCGFDCGEHYKNQKHKKELWVREPNLLSGTGCECCCSHIAVEGINNIPTVATWLVSYFVEGYDEAKKYNVNSNKKIKPICPSCQRVSDKLFAVSQIYKNDSISCSCGDGYSFPNKIMFNILEQLKIDFIPEYSPKWINPKRYDFYIPSLNKIVEMDGGLGHGNNSYGNIEIETSEKDDYKDNMAKLHGTEVIRIDSYYKYNDDRFEYIKNNIVNNKKLNNLFDLSKINWNKCYDFACSNRIKEACELWNIGTPSTGEIAKLMKLNRMTICKYLKEGSTHGWCNYSVEDGETYKKEHVKMVAKEISAKEVICIENGIIIESASEYGRQSLNIFGVKLNSSKISMVCTGKRKHHQGYHFRYTSDLTEEEIREIQENAQLIQAI